MSLSATFERPWRSYQGIDVLAIVSPRETKHCAVTNHELCAGFQRHLLNIEIRAQNNNEHLLNNCVRVNDHDDV